MRIDNVRYVMMCLTCCVLAAAPARAAVVFADGGTGLQGVLDAITIGGSSSVNVVTDQFSDDADTAWSINASGGAILTLVIELDGYSNTNKFGIYDLADASKKVDIFAGAAGGGDQAVISVLASGEVRFNFANTGVFLADNAFGYYLDSSAEAEGGIWYSDTSLNVDGLDHMVAYQGTDTDMVAIAPFAAGLWTDNEFVLAFEDTRLSAPSDRDYTDFVVMIESVHPVPEASAFVIWSLVTMCGMSMVQQRRRQTS
jgi:hypothetical protein